MSLPILRGAQLEAFQERHHQRSQREEPEEDKGTLYGVSWERYNGHATLCRRYGIAPSEVGVSYLHDKIDYEHARAQFIDMLDPTERYTIYIVACAPVVGFHVLDNQGLILKV
jgi:hypothetical protein